MRNIFLKAHYMFFSLHFIMCECVFKIKESATLLGERSVSHIWKTESKKKRESREKREHPFSSFLKHLAENLHIPDIERSDRRDIWSEASQHLGQRFGRLDRGFGVRRFGFREVLHNSNYLGDISSLCVILVPYILMCLFSSVWWFCMPLV